MFGTVISLSHPLGDRMDDPIRWHDNLANAGSWIKFFIDVTPWVILAPWYVYAIVNSGSVDAGRRFVDAVAAMERSDLLGLVGGYISPHMRDYDLKTAKRLGVPVADLTSFGILPPDRHDEDQVQLILSKIRASMMKAPRRVWLPLLTTSDLDELRKARHALYANVPAEPGEFDVAVDLMDRIISAATERGQ